MANNVGVNLMFVRMMCLPNSRPHSKKSSHLGSYQMAFPNRWDPESAFNAGPNGMGRNDCKVVVPKITQPCVMKGFISYLELRWKYTGKHCSL